jgi:ureidoglycolate lyase
MDTQNEIERHLAGGVRPTQTEFIDFMQTHQTRFLVQDPQGPRS